MKWKKRLVKDARRLLPLTEEIKIVRLTSPLPDVLRLSSPRPRLRHSRRHACLSLLNLILNQFFISFVLSPALLPSLLTSQLFLSQKFGYGQRQLLEISLICFLVKGQKPSKARGCLSELQGVTSPQESHSSSWSHFSKAEFIVAATNLSSYIATGPDKSRLSHAIAPSSL